MKGFELCYYSAYSTLFCFCLGYTDVVVCKTSVWQLAKPVFLDAGTLLRGKQNPGVRQYDNISPAVGLRMLGSIAAKSRHTLLGFLVLRDTHNLTSINGSTGKLLNGCKWNGLKWHYIIVHSIHWGRRNGGTNVFLGLLSSNIVTSVEEKQGRKIMKNNWSGEC